MPGPVVLLLIVLGCIQPRVGTAQEGRPCAAVPASPPDSTPVEYETLADTVAAGERSSSPVLRDIVLLQFKRGTSQADKVAAICLVEGVVVGGKPLTEGEGIYLVRIPGDRTARTLFSAIDRLRLLPQTLYAGPEAVLRLRDSA